MKDSPHKDPPADIDRYERLQRAAEIQINNVWEAHKRIGGMLGFAVIAIGAVAAYCLFSNLNDFKKQMRDDIKEEKDLVTKRVTARVEEEFAQAEIKKLVEEKAKERIDQVADKMINAAISNKVAELQVAIGDANGRFELLANKMLAFRDDSRNAEDELAKSLKEAREILRNVTEQVNRIKTNAILQN